MLLAATQLGQLRIQVSAESMLEKGTPAWDYFVATEETFGAEDVAIVVLRDPDIFDRDKLVQARYALRAIADLPGVVGTTSLFDAKNLKNIDDTIHIKPYLENLPETPAEAARQAEESGAPPEHAIRVTLADGGTRPLDVARMRALIQEACAGAEIFIHHAEHGVAAEPLALPRQTVVVIGESIAVIDEISIICRQTCTTSIDITDRPGPAFRLACVSRGSR